jgi:MarR family 2-MHQ and catechol resistance regulon transcriptional repressor
MQEGRMTELERKATELRVLVDEIVSQVRSVNARTAAGPSAELSCQELQVLLHLGDSGPRMMKELAEFLVLAVNSVTSIVDNLETKKLLVQRRRCAEDRRKVYVELNEAGHAAYQSAVAEKLHFLRCMLGALNEDEQEIFMVLFRKIARAGRSEVKRLASPA